MRRLALVASCALLALAPRVDAKCEKQHLGVEVLPDAPNGAIVIEKSLPNDLTGDADTSKWHFKINGKDVAPQTEVLAPGLRVLRLPKGTATGDLVTDVMTLAKVSGLATTVALLPAPKVKAVQHRIDEDRGSARTSIVITGDVPGDALAIVITDAKGKALSFGKIIAGQPLSPYVHGHCGFLPNGTVEPVVGASVRLFWVDKYGRASAKSDAIKIVKAP